MKFAIAVELNNHDTILRCNKMRYAGGNHDETARGIPFQLGGVEFRSLTQIPGAFDDGDQFVLRVRMREDMFAGGNPGTIDPRSALTRVAEQLRSLAAVGNGLSRAAVFEENAREGTTKAKSWNDVVGEGFKKFVDDKVPEGANNLVVAQAVCNEDGGRRWLLENLAKAFETVEASRLHTMILAANPRYIVTTNYDPLIEKAFKRKKYTCYVRDTWKRKNEPERNKASTLVFKMHGTLSKAFRSNTVVPPGPEEETVVISENDYDDCADELVHFQTGLFWQAMKSTLFILGKGVFWEDLSFMRALRERRDRSNNPAYWLLSSSEWSSGNNRLTLKNLRITPILMKLPNERSDAVYYRSFRSALEKIFDGEVPRLPRIRELQSIASYPRVVAIGLSAQNSVGQSGAGTLPKEGRQNLSFKKFHEYAGGSALTALTVCKALCKSKAQVKGKRARPRVLDQLGSDRCALVSIIGDDPTGKAVTEFCQKYHIDDDAVGIIEKRETVRSFVVVRRCDITGTKSKYPGQRIFFDVPAQEKILDLTDYAREQFDAMLSEKNKQLRAVYLDRWLAFSQRAAKQEKDRTFAGFLSQRRYRRVLNKAASRKAASHPKIDIVYETGGKGSEGLWVEKNLAPLINVMTAAFPFFWKRIYNKGKLDGFETEEKEIQNLLNDPRLKLKSKKWVPILPAWTKRAKKFMGRVKRKWLVVTLHHHGALAFHFTNQWPMMRYFEGTPDDLKDIKNTTGAGDTFRGALLFALLKISPDVRNDRNKLARCTAFAVRCATERCKSFQMEHALKRIEEEGYEWWHRGK